MLLSYNALLHDIANAGVITKDNGDPIDLDMINGASIDIALGNEIMVERSSLAGHPLKTLVDLSAKETLSMEKITLPPEGYHLLPGQFILASSAEKFFLPDNIVSEYVLKSSLARSGLGHLLAGYADPGWYDSHLTLELKNESQFHTLLLKPNMAIGQMKFYKVDHVPQDKSYAVVGQYNNSEGVTASRGLRKGTNN